MPDFGQYFIYGLVDLTSQQIRYVGSSKSPTARLQQHLSHSKNTGTQKVTSAWIAELVACGDRPGLVFLEIFMPYSKDEVMDTESEWIWFLRDAGVPLLNRYPILRSWHHKGKSKVLMSCEYSYIKVLTTLE